MIASTDTLTINITTPSTWGMGKIGTLNWTFHKSKNELLSCYGVLIEIIPNISSFSYTGTREVSYIMFSGRDETTMTINNTFYLIDVSETFKYSLTTNSILIRSNPNTKTTYDQALLAYDAFNSKGISKAISMSTNTSFIYCSESTTISATFKANMYVLK